MLNNKRVLLVAPKFFGYEIEIKKAIENMGAEVCFINANPSNLFSIIKGSIERIGLNSSFMVRIFEKRIEQIIEAEKYDYVLIICGWAITSRLTKIIRTNHLRKDGKMILYYWDSMERLKDDVKRWHDFDEISTFDLADYQKHSDNINLLPLFYCQKYWKKINEKPDYDALVIGSFRLDRLEFVRKMKQHNPSLVIESFLVESKKVFKFHKLFRRKYKKVSDAELKFEKLGFDKVVELYGHSKAVLDVPAKGQTGLTIRTIESLAMHKKILTSNATVKYYDFYNPDDIFILPKEGGKLPEKDWFDKPFSIPDSIIQEYSINKWIEKLFKVR